MSRKRRTAGGKQMCFDWYPKSVGGFTVVYTHPFTKRKSREVFISRQEAETRRNDLITRFSQEVSGNPGETLFSDLMIRFLKENPKTQLEHSRRLFVDFCDTFGALKIKDVTTDALRAWLHQIQLENQYKETTMFGIRSKVNIFFRYAISKGALEASPTEGIEYEHRGPETKKKRILISESEVRDLVQKAKAYSPGYFYPIFLAFVETAAKTDEIIELKWDSVDLKRRLIRFPAGEVLSERSIPVSVDLIDLLSKKQSGSDFVFTHFSGKKFRKRQLTIALLGLKKHYGITSPWRYLDLRHSYARNFLIAGGDIRDLKTTLGHTGVHTTKDLYGEYRQQVEIGSPFES